MIALKVLHYLLWLWDHDYQGSSPDFRNFELMQAGTKEATKPGLLRISSMAYKLWENRV